MWKHFDETELNSSDDAEWIEFAVNKKDSLKGGEKEEDVGKTND